MLNKLQRFIREHDLLSAGDHIVCAVSGGADSVAMLFAFYLLREKLGITISAAHFNHQLRGAESDGDEAFVRDFCGRFEIPLDVGTAPVKTGPKGLEAAARSARYNFLMGLPGKIATAHTADDNAETVLMHMIRGTGLKGLGGIAPKRDRLIRPMLEITRDEVLAFLTEYSLPYVQDSSNAEDAFFRNRIRHHILPLMKHENPRLTENLSAMALRLRMDDAALDAIAAPTADVCKLREMNGALRKRALFGLLEGWGVKDISSEHIATLEKLVFSGNPSARADFSGNISVSRCYNRLILLENCDILNPVPLNVPGTTPIPDLGLQVVIEAGRGMDTEADACCVCLSGVPILRSRLSGDEITLPGGTKSLKKLFVDRKIPAHQRNRIPIVEDDQGIVCVYGIGVNRKRNCEGNFVTIRFENL